MARTSPQPAPSTGHSPRVDDVVPAAALPNGEIELTGIYLGPNGFGLPAVSVDNQPAHVMMSRPTRLVFRVPATASAGLIEVRTPAGAANSAAVHVARQLNDGLHPVTSPAVSRSGMVYATISGPRGKQTPVSVVRVSPDGRATPFVTGILNATGLAFNPDGDLFVTSRAEGNVYRVDAAGEFTQYVEGMGVATGAAFDAEGNLFVGDRSGTIFKINPERQIFVHATLEPASPPITSPSMPRARCLSPRPRSRPMKPSGPSSPTATRAPGFAGSAVRRAWPSPARAMSSSPPASMAATDWSASRPAATPRWCSLPPISSASPFLHSAPPSSPPTTPFMMWTWESKA